MKTTLRLLLWLLAGWLGLASARAQELKLVLPTGSNSTSGVFSPDGQLLATTSFAGSVKIWGALDGTLRQELEIAPPAGFRHTGSVSLAFSPDGRQLAAVFSYGNGTVARGREVQQEQAVVWQLATGQPLFVRPVVAGTLTADYSPDGRLLLLQCREDNALPASVCDAATGQLQYELPRAENYLRFSPDGTRLLSESGNVGHVWDARTGRQLLALPRQANVITSLDFSPDGKSLLTTAAGGVATVWDATTGAARTTLAVSAESGLPREGYFSADGRSVLASTGAHTLRRWDAATGQLLPAASRMVVGERGRLVFSPDRQQLAVPEDKQLTIWQLPEGRALLTLPLTDAAGWTCFNFWLSADGQRLAAAYYDAAHSASVVRVLAVPGGQLLAELRGHTRGVLWRVPSPTDPLVALVRRDGQLLLWHVDTGTPQPLPIEAGLAVKGVSFSADGQRLGAVLQGKTLHFATWDVPTGRLLGLVPTGSRQQLGMYNGVGFSADLSRLLLWNEQQPDSTQLWDATTGRLLRTIEKGGGLPWISFSPDGTRVLALGDPWRGTVQVLDARTGTTLVTVQHPRQARPRGSYWPLAAAFSPDSHQLLTTNDGEVRAWDAATGQPLAAPTAGPHLPRLPANAGPGYQQRFSTDGRYLLSYGSAAGSGLPQVWCPGTGRRVMLAGLPGPPADASFGPDGATVLTASNDNILRVWDAATGQLLHQVPHLSLLTVSGINSVAGAGLRYVLSSRSAWAEEALRCQWLDRPEAAYTLLLLDEHDYLVYDRHFRYDGTGAARQLLNLACGSETIGLDQLKDQLWVPGLAERLARGEAIGGPTIGQLGVCGLAPLVEQLPAADGSYHYRIRPRRGGLGQTVLTVNGIEVRRYEPAQLARAGTDYELHLPAAALAAYLVPGQPNPVAVRAYTAGNAVASRGAVLVEQAATQGAPAPNLYAVVVGVSDYKGDGLDLRYAAKDAHDLAGALAASARHLLNHDGQEHVFVQELSTGPGRAARPEKAAIRAALAGISQRAVAGDIVLLFFAGHGVTAGPDKRFYFLTVDASPASATDAGALAAVGISTQELGEWLRPELLKAQKRVLIFDACQSGQAINDFVKLGDGGTGGGQYLAARSDDAGQRIKAVEKLNDQSGLFILSAASSTQSAYELGRYAQGLLTYALLQAIKEQPAILEQGRYLSVGRWFGAAEQAVQELARASGQRQQPQVVSTTNFTIGEVDEGVRHGIALPRARPVFAVSNFQNADPAIVDDDLGLSQLLDQHLQQLGARGSEAPLVYAGAAGLPDAYSLLGRYAVQGSTVQVRVSLRLGRRVVAQFEVSGPAGEVERLAGQVAAEATARATAVH